MSIKRIALVTPPYHSGVVETAGRWPNLAFVYIAGHLRQAGFEPVYYDAMTADHDIPTIVSELERIAPDVVLTSAYTPSYPAAVEMLRAVKAALPGVLTGIGGVHAHFMYEEVLQRDGDVIDYVVRGEGEITAPELMKCLDEGGDPASVAGIAFMRDGSVHATPARPFVHDLDSLVPAWDLVDFSLYRFFPLPGTKLAIMNSSRGCDQACSFCSQQKFWQRSWRARTPE
ncbi:MAG TPA: cobalamin-dependent protein, partial [Coriobacteriia bacterium]